MVEQEALEEGHIQQKTFSALAMIPCPLKLYRQICEDDGVSKAQLSS